MNTTLPDRGLKALDLGFGYRHTPVLKGINLELQRGECVALLGKNGAGKSTLLRLLLGFIRAQQGEVTIDGSPLATLSRLQLAQQLAYVPQSHQPPFPYSAQEVIMLGRLPHHGLFGKPTRDDELKVEMTLQRLRISHLARRPYTRLSGGERQLVMIARALAQEASLLILDEPVNGLDYGNQYRLLDTLRELAADGLGVLMTTHHPDHALHAASRVVLLDAGHILGDGPAAQILTPHNLHRLYDLRVAYHQLANGQKVLVPEQV